MLTSAGDTFPRTESFKTRQGAMAPMENQCIFRWRHSAQLENPPWRGRVKQMGPVGTLQRNLPARRQDGKSDVATYSSVGSRRYRPSELVLCQTREVSHWANKERPRPPSQSSVSVTGTWKGKISTVRSIQINGWHHLAMAEMHGF